MPRRSVTGFGLILALVVLAATVSHSRAEPLDPVEAHPPCNAPGSNIHWVRVAPKNETAPLDRWCSGVGPPLLIETPSKARMTRDVPVIVSWNTHEGGGDIDAFVADLKAGRLTGHPVSSFVLLLQEVYRAGPEVPARGPDMPAWATAELANSPAGKRDDIGTVARRLGLAAYYVPSMRNGKPGVTNEDRGNAILSTAALTDLAAIELPLERQRRVALEATVTIPRPGGDDPLAVRLVCTHFTNMVMHHLWLLSESGRFRQARALAEVLPHDGTLVVGGDFNAWFGYHDAAYKELARAVPAASSEDRRATFGPMRLDHLLFRLPGGWRASVHRGESRYGSDHYPLVATITPSSN